MSHNEVFIIIQARIGSTRLPSKMVLPFFNNLSILEIIIKKIKTIQHKNIHIVLATSNQPENNVLIHLAVKEDILYFSGDEQNVLKRYIDCANHFNAEKIIRICADNPFLDLELLKNIIQEQNNSTYDYIAYKVNDTPSIKTHYGFFSEFVHLEALKKAYANTTEKIYLEHVTNYIYSFEDNFSIHWLDAPKEISNAHNIRLTVDDLQDFELCKKLYQELYEKYNINFGYKEVLTHLLQNKQYMSVMEQNILKYEK